jgi:putative membrane protein
MRTFVKHGVVAVAVMALAVACGQPQRRPPRGASASVSHPTPQRAIDRPQPQAPISEPVPQRSALEPPKPQAPIEEPQPQKPFFGPGTTPDDSTKAKTETPLSDGEVLGAAMAANDGEVQMAELASKKATSADVKHFAGLMKSEHQKALQKDKTLQSKTKIASAESDVSTTLKSDTEKTMKELRDKEGKAFDRAYMDAQVKAHKDVLTAIDNRLVPSAKNGEVKAMLVDMRRHVADHLVKAEDIQKKLEGTASTTSSSSKVGVGVPGPEEKMPSAPSGKQEEQSKARSSGTKPVPEKK